MTENKKFVIALQGFGLFKEWTCKTKEELDLVLNEIKDLEPVLINLLDSYNSFKDKIAKNEDKLK